MKKWFDTEQELTPPQYRLNWKSFWKPDKLGHVLCRLTTTTHELDVRGDTIFMSFHPTDSICKPSGKIQKSTTQIYTTKANIWEEELSLSLILNLSCKIFCSLLPFCSGEIAAGVGEASNERLDVANGISFKGWFSWTDKSVCKWKIMIYFTFIFQIPFILW